MVICAIVGCSNRSDTRADDGSRLSFYGIPTVTDRYGKAELELRKKRRDGFLAAISREDLDINALHTLPFSQAGVSLQYNRPRLVTYLKPRPQRTWERRYSKARRPFSRQMEEGSGKGEVEKNRRIAASFSNRRNPINSSRRD